MPSVKYVGDGRHVTGSEELQTAMRELLADPRKTNITPILVNSDQQIFHIYWREDMAPKEDMSENEWRMEL